MKQKKQIILLAFLLPVFGSFFLAHTSTQASDTGEVNATVQLAICGDGIKDRGEQCDTGDLNGKACVDLGFTGGIMGCTPSCEFDTTSCTTTASASAKTTLTPSADRTYVLSDGDNAIGVSLLQSFYQNDLSLLLFSHNETTHIPGGQNLVGKLYNLIFVNENGDIVHQLNKSTTVTLSYADRDLASADESTLAPYRSEDNGVSWTALSNYTINPSAKTVTFSTTNFSIFSIFGTIINHTTVLQSAGGSGGGSTIEPKKATPEEKKKILKVADFNNDGRVDVTDLSILLYYYGLTDARISHYDLNSDGAIDIIDTSIMLYYWQVTL
jgi:hypothetical protein